MSPVNVVYPRIEDALEVVEAELAVAEAEAEAFRTFGGKLRRLQAVAGGEADAGPRPAVPAGGGAALATVEGNTGVDTASVRSAYRETVMAMDHYDREYGEPLLENVGVEFGAGVRELLSTDGPIAPVHLGVVEEAAERAVYEREQFDRWLADERDSLESVVDRLGEIERRLHELRRRDAGDGDVDELARAERLNELATACQSLSRERQETMHRRPAPQISGVDDGSLVAYLYGDRDYHLPALVEIADVATRIDGADGW